MAKRVKPKESAPVIAGWDEADQTLRQLGEIHRDLMVLQAAEEESIARIKEETNRQVDPLVDKKVVLETALEDFAKRRKSEFKKPRTKSLRFGIIGFRKGTGIFKTLKGWTWAKVLNAIKKFGYTEYVRMKESVDREALEKDHRSGRIDDNVLEAFGVKWHVADDFFYEIPAEDE